MNITIISCSLHPQSRSYVLAQQAFNELKSQGEDPLLVDLREMEIPFCGTTESWDDPATKEIKEILEKADAVLMAAPVYNYDLNAAAKNLLELGLRSWNGTIVGFLCAAGGQRSYMSVLGMANSLMLDFRCLIIPRFVYAVGDDFGDDREPTMYISSDEIKERIQELTSETVRLTKALS